jgi:hypothetical protein
VGSRRARRAGGRGTGCRRLARPLGRGLRTPRPPRGANEIPSSAAGRRGRGLRFRPLGDAGGARRGGAPRIGRETESHFTKRARSGLPHTTIPSVPRGTPRRRRGPTTVTGRPQAARRTVALRFRGTAQALRRCRRAGSCAAAWRSAASRPGTGGVRADTSSASAHGRWTPSGSGASPSPCNGPRRPRRSSGHSS